MFFSFQIIDSVFKEILDDCCGPCPTYKFTGKFFSSLENVKMKQLFAELHGNCDFIVQELWIIVLILNYY